jgi:transcription antitermination protein NusB
MDVKNKNGNQILDGQSSDEETKEIENKIVDSNEDMITPSSRRDVRSLAFHLVYAMEQLDYKVSLESIVDNFRRGFKVNISSDSFAIILSSEVISRRDELDTQMKPILRNWKLERLSCCTKLILRMALCELQQPDAIPNIIINEAIELAKGFAENDAYKFVNGVLDEFVKKVGLKNDKST